MSKRITYLSFAAGLMLPLAAWSAPLSYNYADLAYAYDSVKPSGGSKVDGSGWQIDGSAAFADNFFVNASYSDTNLNKGAPDAKLTSVGVGYDTKIADGTSAYGVVSYKNVDLNKSKSGWGVEGGLRYALTPEAEVNGAIEYVDISNSKKDLGVDLEQEVGFKLGGTYDFTPQFAGVASYEKVKDVDSFRVGVRWNWGT